MNEELMAALQRFQEEQRRKLDGGVEPPGGVGVTEKSMSIEMGEPVIEKAYEIEIGKPRIHKKGGLKPVGIEIGEPRIHGMSTGDPVAAVSAAEALRKLMAGYRP